MTCPFCGGEMERGWLLAEPPVLWSKTPGRLRTQLLSYLVEMGEDLRLPADETGRPPAWKCRQCRKLLLDF